MKEKAKETIDRVCAKFPLGSVFDVSQTGENRIVSEVCVDGKDTEAHVFVYVRTASLLSEGCSLRVLVQAVPLGVSMYDLDKNVEEVTAILDAKRDQPKGAEDHE